MSLSHTEPHRHATFYSQIKSEVTVDNILTNDTSLCINLNIDDVPTSSNTHSPLPLTNNSPPTHVPLLRYPLPPFHLVCTRFWHPPDVTLILSPHRHPSLYIPPNSHTHRDNPRTTFPTPPSVWEDSISSNLISSSFITPTPSLLPCYLSFYPF